MSDFDRVWRAWMDSCAHGARRPGERDCDERALAEFSDSMLDECASVARMRLDTPYYLERPIYVLALRTFIASCEHELIRRGLAWLRERAMATE